MIEIIHSTIPHQIKRSTRCRHARLTITPEKKLIVTLPLKAPLALAETLISQHQKWIVKHLLRPRPARIALPHSRTDYEKNKLASASLVRQRLQFFNHHYQLRWRSVTMKNTTTRWGSCSSLKNLNFNYKIVYLPPELQDYLIVHELCHLQEMNHGEKFWTLVAQTIPHHRRYRRDLRRYAL